MSKLVMHEGTYPDAMDLGERLRGIDKLEVRATNNWAPGVAIEKSIERSSRWWTGTINGQEEMVVGVAPVDHCSGFGAPWMLTTDRFLHAPGVAKDFLRRTPKFVEMCEEGYDVLFNIISEHNHASKRWLRYAGFKIKTGTFHTFGGFRFLEFIKVAPGGHYDLDNL